MSRRDPYAYEGEYGFTDQMDSGFDCTGASSAVMEFKKPDGTFESKTVTLQGPATNGVWGWTVEEDFYVAGKWQRQLVVTFPGQVLISDVERFTIGGRLENPSP